ncbi:hypothetical protein E5Q_05684 [Mixia osmundae IAM 14324]|uniref:Chitin-binding type-4 domain-containing protein n=2 Tax=Mixia osmundae (strain CBS 9802 / IAM 14324 / JCM 22182 / KY 12970) TaxID=764103 RepID=G7E835_MIXOS|nr:hypothetical protein E5Q_05684 [Mixia osmundae IAM 14324]
MLYKLLCAVLIAFSLQWAQAHVELLHPFPLRSSWDPANDWSVVRYDLTNPLALDGSDFPCHGDLSLLRQMHARDEQKVSAKAAIADAMVSPSSDLTHITGLLVAGQNSTFDLTWDTRSGSEPLHAGGSCQISISYDLGKTFVVIHSIIGDCPVPAHYDDTVNTSGYEYPVPADLPPSPRAIFSWSWQNKEGNRELYQTCALVEIRNDRQSLSYTGPVMWKANIFGDVQCRTIQGDVIYTQPGPSLAYGRVFAATHDIAAGLVKTLTTALSPLATPLTAPLGSLLNLTALHDRRSKALKPLSPTVMKPCTAVDNSRLATVFANGTSVMLPADSKQFAKRRDELASATTSSTHAAQTGSHAVVVSWNSCTQSFIAAAHQACQTALTSPGCDSHSLTARR